MKVLCFMWGMSMSLAAFAGQPTKWGGRAWTLWVQSDDDAMLEAMRPNTYIPWCFSPVKGRGVAKTLKLRVHWHTASELLLSLDKVGPLDKEEKEILICLNQSLNAFPPSHKLAESVLELSFIRGRR